MDRPSTITAELPVAGPKVVRPDVAIILRDTSMRLLETALAIGALATALLLGVGR